VLQPLASADQSVLAVVSTRVTLPTPLLQVEQLRTTFQSREGTVVAVDGVSFQLELGETLGVVGESGSGKSVTALSIMGLQRPGRIVNGSVLFRGRDLVKLSPDELRKIRGRQIAMIFQDPMVSLNPVFSVGWQVAEPLRLHQKLSRRLSMKRAIEMLGKVGIQSAASRANDYPHTFSGGMRQRAMIGMGLGNEPQLLIADEPTTALDVTIQAQILDLLRTLSRDFGTACILITHNLGVVAGMCDRVIVMYAGKVVESGTTKEVFKNPKHPYTRGLLRSIPRLDAKRGQPLQAIKGTPPNLARLPTGCSFHPRCPYKVERCSREDPALEVVGPGRLAACWVTQGGADLNGD
jgi:oligopeptide transport system ATP-binding protein